MGKRRTPLPSLNQSSSTGFYANRGIGSKNAYNAIFEFDEIIKACKDYWGMEDTKFAAFIKEAETLLSQDTIDFLVISISISLYLVLAIKIHMH